MFKSGKEMKHRLSAKQTLRLAMASRRDELSEEERAERSQQACGYASELMKRLESKSMMIYVPFRSELDSRPLIEWAWEQGVHVIIPRSTPEHRSMELYELHGWNELVPGAYGIWEPDPSRSQKWMKGNPDIIWVPGLAFDRKGGRLGYGGGYYDRLSDRLAKEEQNNVHLPREPLWMGIAYEVQVVEHVPMEDHDRVLDGLVTERGHFVRTRPAPEG